MEGKWGGGRREVVTCFGLTLGSCHGLEDLRSTAPVLVGLRRST